MIDKSRFSLSIVKRPIVDSYSILKLNKEIFAEDRLINHFEHDDIQLYEARLNAIPVGFKVGYALSKQEYYSAKGGVLQPFRRIGIAEKLTLTMIVECKQRGYRVLSYDTLPEKYPGMFELGLKLGFVQVSSVWDERYKAHVVRMSLVL